MSSMTAEAKALFASGQSDVVSEPNSFKMNRFMPSAKGREAHTRIAGCEGPQGQGAAYT